MKKINLSYAITVCSEHIEIQKLVTFLLDNKRTEDEIVITYDSNNGSKGVEEYLRSHSVNGEFSWHPYKFDGNFSDLKNYTKSMCSGDYIVHLDADELPHETLMEQLPQIIEMNDVDLIYLPRINTVDGITEQHIKQWGWKVTAPFELYNEKVMDTESEEYKLLKKMDLIVDENIVKYKVPIINAPDYQARVFRNIDEIYWVGKVHERITGCKTYSHLPPHEELSLYHPKTIDKQVKQNELYEGLMK